MISELHSSWERERRGGAPWFQSCIDPVLAAPKTAALALSEPCFSLSCVMQFGKVHRGIWRGTVGLPVGAFNLALLLFLPSPQPS